MIKSLLICLFLSSVIGFLHKKEHKSLNAAEKKSTNLCRNPANLLNQGTARPLRVVNTINDAYGVPKSSDIELDLETEDYRKYDAWCVTQDIYIQSFTNGLYLESDDGSNLFAGKYNGEKWTAYPNSDYSDNKYREFRINGKALTAHRNSKLVTLEDILEDNHADKSLQLWNVHYP